MLEELRGEFDALYATVLSILLALSKNDTKTVKVVFDTLEVQKAMERQRELPKDHGPERSSAYYRVMAECRELSGHNT